MSPGLQKAAGDTSGMPLLKINGLYIYIYIYYKYIYIYIYYKYIYISIYIYTMFEGSLEIKLPTIWTDEKQSRAEAERRGRLEERRSEEKE